MNHIEFIEKHVREELLKLGFSLGVAQGGISGYRHVQAHEPGKPKGEDFDDVLRHAKLWAEKQQLPADRFEKRKVKRNAQPGLF